GARTSGLGPGVVPRCVGPGTHGDVLAMRISRGQALLETAIVLPVMVVLMLGFLAILIRIEAQVELETATSLAAAAAVAAPANSPQSAVDAADTWRGTLHQYVYLRPGTLSPSCGPYQP